MKEKRKISIILYTVRSSPLPYADKLKKLRDIGYRSIQGGLVPGMTMDEQKALHDSLDMEISCFAGGIDDIKQNPGKYVEGCKKFDCNEIMIGTIPTELRIDYDGYMRAIDQVNEAGKILSKDGLFISYHNHAQEFRRFKNGKTGMDLLYENLDPVGVRFLPDTHWLQSGGADILLWLNKLKGRMGFLHVKDYRIAPANYLTGIGDTEKQFAQIGDGALPWREIVDTALECGVRSFIVEQDFTYGQDPFDCAADSYQTLKGLGLE